MLLAAKMRPLLSGFSELLGVVNGVQMAALLLSGFRSLEADHITAAFCWPCHPPNDDGTGYHDSPEYLFFDHGLLLYRGHPSGASC